MSAIVELAIRFAIYIFHELCYNISRLITMKGIDYDKNRHLR